MASACSPDAKAPFPACSVKRKQDFDEEVGSHFPIDVSKYKHVSIDPWSTHALSEEQKSALAFNVQLCRDAIVFFTASGGASGYGGHTGGAFDMMPEVCILDAFFHACPEKMVQTFFDEAGHRVSTQYLFFCFAWPHAS